MNVLFIKKFTGHACPPGDDICRSTVKFYRSVTGDRHLFRGRHPPQDAKAIPKFRVKVNQGTPGGKIRRRAMAEEIYPTQYGPAYQRYYGLREGFLQTDE